MLSEVGKSVIAWIADLQPFLALLEDEMEARRTSSSLFLFCEGHEPMSTVTLSAQFLALANRINL